MKASMSIRHAAAVATALALLAGVRTAAAQPPQPDALALFVVKLEKAAQAGDRDALAQLAADPAVVQLFAAVMRPAPTRVVIKERDRTPLEGGAQRLLLEVLIERGAEGRVGTWRADVAVADGANPQDAASWRLTQMDRLAVVNGLYRLTLDTTRQFDVRNLTLTAPDLALHMVSGSAFVAVTPEGPTAVVLIGRGQMRFSPPDPAERTQVRIFSGLDALDADFDVALVRVRPAEFDSRFPASALVPRAVASSDARRASEYFEEYIGKTLQIDLTDLSRDRWSLTPLGGDVIAEVRTRRLGNLTYARVGNDAEDISVFDRKRRKNIASYASADKLAERGRFYSEDDLIDYDVQRYEIDVSFNPERLWIEGNARMLLKVRAPSVNTISLRLAETLVVRSVFSPDFGRMLNLRVVGQNTIIISLPVPLERDAELPLQIVYAGRVEPQVLDREAISVQQEREQLVIPPEPRFIYSNRSYWYPQSTVTDYATARLRIVVPAEYDVVASGTPVGAPAPAPGPVESGSRARKMFVFDSDRPARYLACVISRFNMVTSAELHIPSPDTDTARGEQTSMAGPVEGAASGDPSLSLVVQANPRQAGRARAFADRSADILKFYASLVGEAPYPSFTLALSESDLPGGHSPAYFAVLNQALPSSPYVWRNDPVAFENYPTFFLAHELAHQWWGQAIGWKNYHEQWISEGFAQYFAALYGERERGAETFLSILRQMRRWAIDAAAQGPVYLGYRLGHIKSDGRIFRAVVYNKAAMVLHMLRRLVGDDAFFDGMRRFYTEWRFRKAGTDDFRQAMEAASGRDLNAFFDAWIYGSSTPRLRLTYEVDGAKQVGLKLQHLGDVVPTPVTVTLVYASGDTEEVLVQATEQTVTRVVALKGTLREVLVNQDNAAVAEFEK
jgi:peptidase M1-like protein